MPVIAQKNGLTLGTSFGTAIVEGTGALSQGAGTVLTFTISEDRPRLGSVFVVVEPVLGQMADFWDDFWSSRTGGQPANSFALSDYVELNGTDNFSIKLNIDRLDEANETFAVRVFGSVLDHEQGLAPLVEGRFTIIDDDDRPSEGNDRITGTAGSDRINALGGADTVSGGEGHDTLSGGAGNDDLIGGSGNDYLYGQAGADVMLGGTGNDRYVVDATDRVVEALNGGTDMIAAAASWTLGANVENLRLTGSAALRGAGNGLNNVIDGNSGANLLRGFAGDDRIYGGSGADTLSGGLGRDYLSGGADRVRDVFDFNSIGEAGRGTGRDTIGFFTHRIDDIDLAGIDANTRRAGDQVFVYGGAHAVKNGVWVVDAGRDLVVRGDVNGDARADFEIVVTRVDHLDKWDFLL